MIAISDKLRHQVMKLAEQYEKPEFITDDPVQFPRRFGYKCSQEIVGFIAAWLAYGNRKAILSTCEKLCKEMERLTPYMYIKNMGWRKYIDSEEPLYRFFKEKDFADLCRALKEIYDNNEDMEEALSKNYSRTMGATDYLDALISLFPGVKGLWPSTKSTIKAYQENVQGRIDQLTAQRETVLSFVGQIPDGEVQTVLKLRYGLLDNSTKKMPWMDIPPLMNYELETLYRRHRKGIDYLNMLLESEVA